MTDKPTGLTKALKEPDSPPIQKESVPPPLTEYPFHLHQPTTEEQFGAQNRAWNVQTALRKMALFTDQLDDRIQTLEKKLDILTRQVDLSSRQLETLFDIFVTRTTTKKR